MVSLNKLLPILLLAVGVAYAAPEPSPQDLKKVQKAIDETSRQVKSKKSAQNQITAEISATDKKLKQQRAELDKILREKKQATAHLHQLQQNAFALQTRIDGTRTQVARLLSAQYRNRQPDAVVLMLQNTDPNDKGRQLHYMRYIQSANQKVIDELGVQQAELARQSAEISAQIERIQGLLAKQQKIVRELTRQKNSQLSAADKLDDDITRHEKRIKSLKGDEARLSTLLQRISSEKARRRAAEQRRLNEQRAAAAKARAERKERIAGEEDAAPATPETPEVIADETPQSTAFARLQGKLRLPVTGTIAGRFGGKKPSGGAYNGLYIGTAAQSVQAVAAGDIAYAGDLRGYGNTVIVDHDGAYLTVYAGLDSLSVSRGNHVADRQSLGRSGALPGEEPGLYFEIRYHTRPLNPMSWLR